LLAELGRQEEAVQVRGGGVHGGWRRRLGAVGECYWLAGWMGILWRLPYGRVLPWKSRSKWGAGGGGGEGGGGCGGARRPDVGPRKQVVMVSVGTAASQVGWWVVQ
jgi:hypothetical protein